EISGFCRKLIAFGLGKSVWLPKVREARRSPCKSVTDVPAQFVQVPENVSHLERAPQNPTILLAEYMQSSRAARGDERIDTSLRLVLKNNAERGETMTAHAFRLSAAMIFSAVMAAILGNAPNAAAMPMFSRKLGVPCNFCHTTIPR